MGSLSSAIIDRKTGGERAKTDPAGTVPDQAGTLLKPQISIHTRPNETVAVPGFEEIDLVGHQMATASVNSAEPSR